MTSNASPADRSAAAFAALGRSPFLRLTELLAGLAPQKPLINLSVGEPQHGIPDFIAPVIARHVADFGKYPPIKGHPVFLEAAANWLTRRFDLPRALDPASEILALNGSREGLFLAALAARRMASSRADPVMLMPNPFYPAYAVGALAAGCEAVHLPTTADTGFLPDLDAIPDALLARCVAFYIASPANPQGAVAGPAYFQRLIALARRHDFIVLSDECYSEIYTQAPPGSILEQADADYAHTVAFQSLSKRSNLPGLRAGFVAGDRRFITQFLELRAMAGPQVALPLQFAAAAAYDDEAHVEANRALYREKFDIAERLLGNRFAYYRPAGGFCLWLDVSAQGGDERVTQRLWHEAGVRVIPGSYLGAEQSDGSNPGRGYIRVALVHDAARIEEALERMLTTLDRVE